jgi:hypothetical protein
VAADTGAVSDVETAVCTGVVKSWIRVSSLVQLGHKINLDAVSFRQLPLDPYESEEALSAAKLHEQVKVSVGALIPPNTGPPDTIPSRRGVSLDSISSDLMAYSLR